jgi:hypothetical protein
VDIQADDSNSRVVASDFIKRRMTIERKGEVRREK